MPRVPLNDIVSVTIPAVVPCEVEGCSWLIPNGRGSFQEYSHHLRQHSDEELQPLRDRWDALPEHSDGGEHAG